MSNLTNIGLIQVLLLRWRFKIVIENIKFAVLCLLEFSAAGFCFVSMFVFECFLRYRPGSRARWTPTPQQGLRSWGGRGGEDRPPIILVGGRRYHFAPPQYLSMLEEKNMNGPPKCDEMDKKGMCD